jgi:hypothetical protein
VPGPEERAGSRGDLSDVLERLLGRPVASLDGPLHIPAPSVGGLGRGPLDRADRPAQCRAEMEQAARSRVGVVAAPDPLAVSPAAFDDALRLRGTAAEVTPEFGAQGTVPLFGRPPPGQSAVVGHPGRPHLGDELPIPAVGTPGTLVVDREHLCAEAFGIRWVSWSHTPGSGGSYMIRPAGAGDRVTMTWRPTATRPPRQVTVTRSPVWSIVSTGESRTTRSPSAAASRSGICEVPPTKRLVCARPSDSASRSAVTPQTATLCSRHSSDTSTVGTARMPTVQISSNVRATRDRPWPSYHWPAVNRSQASASGASQGASAGTVSAI